MAPTSAVRWERDQDIRARLRSEIADLHRDDENVDEAIIVEEMGLCEGQARLDLGVINGRFIGYEIKSPRDTLTRLPGQVDVYSRTLDQVEVITSDAHLEGVLAIVPTWWGVRLVIPADDGFALRVVRAATQNPGWDPMSLVQLLWRDEALDVLEELGLDRGVRSKPKLAIWERLVRSVGEDELHRIVLGRVKAREGWSTARPLA